MKKILWLCIFVPFYAWAGIDGIWKSSQGDFWVLLHEAAGTTFAVQLDPTLARSTLWSGSLTASTAQLTSQGGTHASLTVNGDSSALSGTLGSQTFSAMSLLPHFGGGYDGIYAVSGGGRYLVYLTVADGSRTGSILLLDLAVGATGITHQLYWGEFSPSTRKLSGSSLTSSGATMDLTVDESGVFTGRLRGQSLTATPAIYQALPEMSTDYLGYAANSSGYASLSGKNVKVVNLPEEESFLALYTPAVVQKNRVMVVVHGTDGTPYEEIKDEVDYADQYGYIVLGIQWHNKATGTYATGKSVYRIIGKALDHLQRTTGNDLSRVAYVGFSRGSAVSYEVTWRDRQGRQLFDLTVSHSGGIPLALNAAATGDDPDVFFGALTNGTLGSTALSGAKFFLYCGERDEQWGTEMCQQINNANTLIERNAGSVVRLIDDPLGRHAGYRVNASYHTAGVQAFIDATP